MLLAAATIRNMPTHRVAEGEDLRSIARQYYGDGTHAALIVAANPGVFGDDRSVLESGALLAIPVSAADATEWARASAVELGVDASEAVWPVRSPVSPEIIPVEEDVPDRIDWIEVYWAFEKRRERRQRWRTCLIILALIVAVILGMIGWDYINSPAP